MFTVTQLLVYHNDSVDRYWARVLGGTRNVTRLQPLHQSKRKAILRSTQWLTSPAFCAVTWRWRNRPEVVSWQVVAAKFLLVIVPRSNYITVLAALVLGYVGYLRHTTLAHVFSELELRGWPLIANPKVVAHMLYLGYICDFFSTMHSYLVYLCCLSPFQDCQEWSACGRGDRCHSYQSSLPTHSPGHTLKWHRFNETRQRCKSNNHHMRLKL